MRSVAVACVCVCVSLLRLAWALTFKCIHLQISFSVFKYIFGMSRSKSSIKVMRSRSRSQEQNNQMSVTKYTHRHWYIMTPMNRRITRISFRRRRGGWCGEEVFHPLNFVKFFHGSVTFWCSFILHGAQFKSVGCAVCKDVNVEDAWKCFPTMTGTLSRVPSDHAPGYGHFVVIYSDVNKTTNLKTKTKI